MVRQPRRRSKVAILLTPADTEQVEFTEPKTAIKSAGADADVISAQVGPDRTVNHDLEPLRPGAADDHDEPVSCPAAQPAGSSASSSWPEPIPIAR
jgi:hypothetical protein